VNKVNFSYTPENDVTYTFYRLLIDGENTDYKIIYWPFDKAIKDGGVYIIHNEKYDDKKADSVKEMFDFLPDAKYKAINRYFDELDKN